MRVGILRQAWNEAAAREVGLRIGRMFFAAVRREALRWPDGQSRLMEAVFALLRLRPDDFFYKRDQLQIEWMPEELVEFMLSTCVQLCRQRDLKPLSVVCSKKA